MEELSLEGTFGHHHLVQPLFKAGAIKNSLLRAASSYVLNICKDGDSTTSLGNLLQCLTTEQ